MQKSIPNVLSAVRLIMSPLVLVTAYRGDPVLSGGFFLILAVTDALDGLLARILKAETLTGKVLDPLADKVLLLAGLVSTCYLLPGRIDPLILKLVLARDLALVGGSLMLMRVGFVPTPSPAGKVATVSLVFLVSAVYLKNLWSHLPEVVINLLYRLSLALVILSWADYTLRGLKFITDKLIMERR